MARSGASLDGAPDQVINSDRVAVFNHVENSVHARRQNAWINAKENVPANRKYSKRSSVASSVAERQKRAREGGKDADLEGMVPGPQPVRLSNCPEFLLAHPRLLP
jgi:hypothetical protein